MLYLNSKFYGAPVLNLELGGPVASLSEEIIDPDSLNILGFFTEGSPSGRAANILPASSIREFSSYGAVIDSNDDFVSRSDVIKIDKILDYNFHLVGLKVETKKGTNLGKVTGYTVDPSDFKIQQIIVHRPLLKSFSDPELTIPRREITEVTDTKVIVKDEEDVIKKRAEKEDFIPNFVNPFRTKEPGYAPSDIKEEKS